MTGKWVKYMENRMNVNRKIVNGRVVDSRVSSVSRQSNRPTMNSLANRQNSGLNTAMSRSSFLRTAGLVGGAVAAAGLGLGKVARAAPTDPWPIGDANPDPSNIISDGSGGWIVYPTGDDTILPEENPYAAQNLVVSGLPMTRDSRNVQWALAYVDTSVNPKPQVLLKAKKNDNANPMYFNFLLNVGDPFTTHAPLNILYEEPIMRNNAAQVAIFKNVAIVGETMVPYTGTFPGGEAPEPRFTPDRTMIYGGINVFINDYPYDVSPGQLSGGYIRPSNISIKNIYFAYPSRGAVSLSYCSGFECSDCVIYDLFGAEEIYLDEGLPFRLCMGIELSALFLPDAGPLMEPNPYLFGNCTITNNRIKRRAESLEPTPFGPMLDYGFVDIGIFTQWTNMTIKTSNNEVHNFPNSGILLEANTGTTEFTNNKIYNCSFQGLLYPFFLSLEGVIYESGAIGGRFNMAPLRIASNYIECGYEYGKNRINQPTNEIFISGKTQNGILISGTSNATVENNIIKNDGTLQDVPGASHNAIFLDLVIDYGSIPSLNNKFLRNNSKGLLSGANQVYLGIGCDGNVFQNNEYGAISTDGLEMAGAFIRSNGNTFVNDNFWGNYTGINGTPMIPCMWFASGALNNTVSALKNGQAIQGITLCNQIYFETGTAPPANTVNGYSKCAAIPQAVMDAMAAKKAAFIARKKVQCQNAKGTWNETTQTCDLSKYP